jgi:hypothetical protein
MAGRRQITIGPEALVTKTDLNSGSFHWSSVQRIRRTSQFLFIYVSPMNAFIIPKREFADPEEFDALHRRVCQWWKASGENQPASSITTEPSP